MKKTQKSGNFLLKIEKLHKLKNKLSEENFLEENFEEFESLIEQIKNIITEIKNIEHNNILLYEEFTIALENTEPIENRFLKQTF